MRFRLLLLPFSLLYGIITWIRNKCFDWGIFKEVSFSLRVISVGNITVGGTGKTPHVEYLTELLKNTNTLAVLSRGYKRSTKGYILADSASTPASIGDEPFQMYRKNPDIAVAVCEKRVEGIKQLVQVKKDVSLVILDDAYQHRHVKSGLSILLVDYNRPLFNDYILPAGSLREYKSGVKRADIVVVTKSPDLIEDALVNVWRNKLKLNAAQQLFFSHFKYGNFTLANNRNKTISVAELSQMEVVVVAGIANPKPFLEYLKKIQIEFKFFKFADHHNFSNDDMRLIQAGFEAKSTKPKVVITTEKDAVRLMHTENYPEELKTNTYYLPISVKILNNEQTKFEKIIKDYVGEN